MEKADIEDDNVEFILKENTPEKDQCDNEDNNRSSKN